MRRRDLLRAAALATAAGLMPVRPAAAQRYTASSISQAAQDARREVGRLGTRADALLRHVIADGPAHDARAVRRFRGEQARLARDLAAVFNSRVSEDDWLLIVPTRELDWVLAMRPLAIRLVPTADAVEAAVAAPLAQIEPLAGDGADDAVLAIVLKTLGVERQVALFEQLRDEPTLKAALADAAAAVKAARYGLAAFELERVMRAMLLPVNVAAVTENFGDAATRRLYAAVIVRFVPFIGWTYFVALLLATIYLNRDTSAPMLR
jgi:hypothetical protein